MNFECLECSKVFSAKNGWSKHISTFHDPQKYYDKWILSNNDDTCQICGNKNIFISAGKGYKNGCSRNHIIRINHNKIEESLIKKYGVKSSLSLNKNRIVGMIKKYGVKNAGELDFIKEKIKKTNLYKYGVENPYQSEIFKKKIRETNLQKYGVEYPTQSYDIRQKIKESFKKSYNCEYALQNPEFFKKQQEYSRYSRKFKESNVYYRSSYEFDFLYRYYDKYKIINGPTTRYLYNGKNKIYYPDFLLPELNLIVEIKSSYLAVNDHEILVCKEKAIKKMGYNFIMIINKNYIEFEKLLSTFSYSIA